MKDLHFDSSDFDKKFDKIVKDTIPSLIEIGLGRAMLQLLNDCVMEIPTVPLKEGWLRGSGSIFVQNKLVGVSAFGRPGKGNIDFSEAIGINELVGIIGFNAPYAARLHEGLGFKFREPSSGPKYLESKLHKNKETYLEIISNAVKEGGK